MQDAHTLTVPLEERLDRRDDHVDIVVVFDLAARFQAEHLIGESFDDLDRHGRRT